MDDPDLALTQVRVEQAGYWDLPSNRMVQLIRAAKAPTIGTRYEQGEDEKITLTDRPPWTIHGACKRGQPLHG